MQGAETPSYRAGRRRARDALGRVFVDHQSAFHRLPEDYQGHVEHLRKDRDKVSRERVDLQVFGAVRGGGDH